MLTDIVPGPAGEVLEDHPASVSATALGATGIV